MTYLEAANYINAQPGSFLQPAKRSGFICPICGSGSGKNGTGIVEDKKNRGHFTCFAHNCFTEASTVDILALKSGVCDISPKNFREVIKVAASVAGIYLEDKKSLNSLAQKKTKNTISASTTAKVAKTPLAASYVETCRKNLYKTDYLTNIRGISAETLARFPIGFDEKFAAGGGKFWKAVIFFTGDASYEARNTDIKAEADQRHRKMKGASQQIFNVEALNGDEPVFIVESIIDALSIIDVGGQAVSAGGTSGLNEIVKLIQSDKVSAPYLILAFDNDKDEHNAGQTANNKGLAELVALNYPCEIATPYGEYKDANEALCKDRAKFKTDISEIVNNVKSNIQRAKVIRHEKYMKNCNTDLLPCFLNEIAKRKNFYNTGFPSLDDILDGGFYSGLYILGAISSIGKTTFCLQIVDNIAAQGHDVIIFSLEMSRYELIAKSLSRMSYEMYKCNKKLLPSTTRNILNNNFFNNESTKLNLYEVLDKYGDYGVHIFVKEGIGNLSVEDIRMVIKEHIKETSNTPVVMIDYLQILAPPAERLNDKQAIDKNVVELKRISRDFNIPIIGISSLNRDNYNSPINLAAFKESGAIEYGSDVLLGLQFKGMDYIDGETESTRKKRIQLLYEQNRKDASQNLPLLLQLKVMKNRNGRKDSINLKFLSCYNYFEQAEDDDKKIIKYSKYGDREIS